MCCAILLWKKLCFRNTWTKLEAGKGQKKCMRGWGWGSLARTVSWLCSLSVIIVTTQHQHPPSPHHLHHHHTGLLVSTTFPRPIFPGYSTTDRFPYPFIYFNKGNSFYTPQSWNREPLLGVASLYNKANLYFLLPSISHLKPTKVWKRV